MNIIFIFDRLKNIIGYLSNEGAKPIAPFFNETFTMNLSTGANAFQFSTKNNTYTSRLIELGNYAGFMYEDKFHMFQLMDDNGADAKKRSHLTMYCESIGLELIGDYVEPFFIEGNIKTFLNVLLQDTEFQVGHIDDELLNNIQQVKETESKKVYSVLQANLSTFGNIEIEFRTEFENNIFQGFYIDVYANGNRGRKTYKRFESGRNVDYVKKKSNLYEFASAGIGEGESGVTFKDIEWSKAKGDPCDKPKGQNFIVNHEANDKYNRGNKYIKKLYKINTKDPRELLRLTWEALILDGEPHCDYDVSLAMTTEEFKTVRIGDTVNVCDFDYIPAVLLQARIEKLEISFTNPNKNKCLLSNYKRVKSNIPNLEYDAVFGNLMDYINSLKPGILTQTQINQLTFYMKQLDMEEEEINKIIEALKQTASDKFEEEGRNKIKGENIDILLNVGRNYLCETVKQLKFRMPTTADSKYKTRLQFRTTKDTLLTSLYQDANVWISGVDAINGALVVKADTTYTIDFKKNTNSAITQMYYGTVTKTHHGGSAAVYKNKTDYVSKIRDVMQSYYHVREKFKYAFTTIFTFSNPCTSTNIAKWTNSDGTFNIDCSTFTQLCFRGIKFEDSTYKNNKVSPYFLSNKYKYSFECGKRTASDQAKYCIEKGWQLDINMQNRAEWRKLQAGDIVFWETRTEASEDRVSDRYMRVSHVAIVSSVLDDGDVTTYEATSKTEVLLNRRISNNFPEKILFVARPRR
ncbi:CHAP domain-containing protein [Clostridium perfringens]|uniref:CHAP domain-containing protein n=1 Tax=Clostridium perfringens TaxID=1502 RepID=UPI00232C3575|nr:CHAP domain-containing protein [Clostridium perfringens]MDB2049347.1 CHAP domain-containing protein [Clostridium perfringens]